MPFDGILRESRGVVDVSGLKPTAIPEGVRHQNRRKGGWASYRSGRYGCIQKDLEENRGRGYS